MSTHYTEQELGSYYEEIGLLPRWCYTDDEWIDLVLDSDHRQDERLFIEMPPELNMLKSYMNGEL